MCRVVHDDTSVVLLANVGHPIRRTMRAGPHLWPRQAARTKLER